MRAKARRSGGLGVVVGVYGLLDLVVNAGRRAIATKQRRWDSVVEEGQAIGGPGLQCRPQPRADAKRWNSSRTT